MALGRIEAIYERTGQAMSITDRFGKTREHELWQGNPAWNPRSRHRLIDGQQARPYISRYSTSSVVFNKDYRPRAGRVFLTDAEKDVDIVGPFAVISPRIKYGASQNKAYPVESWEKAIIGLPLPVYQLGPNRSEMIAGTQFYRTPTVRAAAAVIARATVVLTNEGGAHHLAASMRRPAVVVFGGFANPMVTGYHGHANLVGDLEHIGCGRYHKCAECEISMARITPDMVKMEAMRLIYESTTP